MTMGKRQTCRQEPLFLAATELPRTPAHPFYERLNQILAENQFDPFVEGAGPAALVVERRQRREAIRHHHARLRHAGHHA